MKRNLLVLISLVVALLAACSSSGGGGVGGGGAQESTVSSWAFLDSATVNGINKDPSRQGNWPQLTVLGSKLYATWSESNGTVSQTRVAVYSGNDASPSWAFVDGNGSNGINKDVTRGVLAPQLTAFGSKLYATWFEDNGSTFQVRVAVYNGNDASPSWTFVDGNSVNGINKDVTKLAKFPQLAAFGSKLYATWSEYNGTTFQVRVAVYNGDDASPSWTFVDENGANGLGKGGGEYPQLTAFGSKLYATWNEYNGAASMFQIRVAVYNGDDNAPSWTSVEGSGFDKNGAYKDTNPQLTVLGAKLYATWYEFSGTVFMVRVAVYNGNDASPAWTFVDGNGINKDATQHGFSSQLTVLGSKLYATWFEPNGTTNQVRVAVYNGNDSSPAWSLVDGNGVSGINKNAGASCQYSQLTAFNSKLYATWVELDGAGQIRFAVGQ